MDVPPSGIGHALRRAREARGLSVADVEQETRIRQGYLAVLEDKRFAALVTRTFVPPGRDG